MDIDDLLEALQRLLTEKQEYDKAEDAASADGDHSFDWSGSHFDALQQAKDDFAKAFEAYIDARIAKAKGEQA